MKRATLKSPVKKALAADAFVATGTAPAASATQATKVEPAAPTPMPVKRLTLDLSPASHMAFKIHAAGKGIGMVDLLRAWIEDATGVDARPEGSYVTPGKLR